MNLITNIGLDMKTRFIIDSKRGYMWIDDQKKSKYIASQYI